MATLNSNIEKTVHVHGEGMGADYTYRIYNSNGLISVEGNVFHNELLNEFECYFDNCTIGEGGEATFFEMDEAMAWVEKHMNKYAA